MSNLISKVQNQRNFDPEEEMLYKEYKLGQQTGRELSIMAGVDGGSTRTRLRMLDLDDMDNAEDDLVPLYVIPSISSTVSDDRFIAAKSKLLIDNMESTIVNQDGKQESLVKTARLVRGTKKNDVELSENRLKSVKQKTGDSTFYFNILDGLGYALVMKYPDDVPTKVRLHLSVPVPPDDNNPKNVELLKNNLQKYLWTTAAGAIKVEFELAFLHVMTEPEAAVKGYFGEMEEEVPSTVLHIEGGGRSMGTDLLVNGVSLAPASKTLEYGGTQLQEQLSKLYVETHGGRPLDEHIGADALKTGLVKKGRGAQDVTDLVKRAKDMFSQRVMDDVVLKVFDQQTTVSPEGVEVVTFGGRLMDEGEYEYSLHTPLASLYRAISPDTEFVHINENHIPMGLVLMGLSEYFEQQGEESEEVVAESDVLAQPLPTSVEEVNSAGEVQEHSSRDEVAGD